MNLDRFEFWMHSNVNNWRLERIHTKWHRIEPFMQRYAETMNDWRIHIWRVSVSDPIPFHRKSTTKKLWNVYSVHTRIKGHQHYKYVWLTESKATVIKKHVCKWILLNHHHFKGGHSLDCVTSEKVISRHT